METLGDGFLQQEVESGARRTLVFCDADHRRKGDRNRLWSGMTPSIVPAPLSDLFADELLSNRRKFEGEDADKPSGWWHHESER